MPADMNYERYKSDIDNTTPINITIKAAEKPNATAAVAGGGTTGHGVLEINADLDESGGADVQPIFRTEVTPTIGGVHPGEVKFHVAHYAIHGDASEVLVAEYNITHPDSMDTIQTDGGRARQA